MAPMSTGKSRLARSLAVAIAVCVTTAATPTTASAEVENVWSIWAERVLDREHKVEIPLAILASIPAMLMITPIWAGQVALDAWTSDDEDE